MPNDIIQFELFPLILGMLVTMVVMVNADNSSNACNSSLVVMLPVVMLGNRGNQLQYGDIFEVIVLVCGELEHNVVGSCN